MEDSIKRNSIHQEKEAAKKQKLETTVAENEVDEKQEAECTKAEKEVAEKQNAESTEDEKAIAKKREENDAYDALLLSIERADWQSDTDPEDEDILPFPSISVEDSEEDMEDWEEEDDASSEEVSSVASALREKEKLEADIERAVATDKRRRKENEGREKQE